MGIRPQDMVPAALRIAVADNVEVPMVGAAFMVLTGWAEVRTSQMEYFSADVEDFYLSKEACRSLGVIPEEFPAVKEEAFLLSSTFPNQSIRLGNPGGAFMAIR